MRGVVVAASGIWWEGLVKCSTPQRRDMGRLVHPAARRGWRGTRFLLHPLLKALVLSPLVARTALFFRPRASISQSASEEKREGGVPLDDMRKLTRYTNPFFRLDLSSTRGFGLPYNWSISGSRQVVFRYSFRQFHIDPEPSLVVGRTLEVEHRSPNLRRFRDLPRLLGSSCCMA